MKLILIDNVETLGIIGTEVDVAKGYARNYLIPQKKAVPANEANRLVLERKRVRWEAKLAEQRILAEQMAERVAGISLTIEAKVADEGKLYGSVNRRQIVAELEAKGVEVERSAVKLDEPIKALGTYQITIHLFSDVSAEITVEVISDAPEEEAAEAPAEGQDAPADAPAKEAAPEEEAAE